MAEPEMEYVNVHTLADRFEADVITDALEQEGIPVIVRQFMDTAYSNIFVHQKGWGRIMVPKEQADLAREIIAELSAIEENTPPPATAELRGEPDNSGGQLDRIAEQLGGLQVEPRLWETLRQADPREVAARTLTQFDPERNGYVVTLLNTAVLCRPQTEEMEVAGGPPDFSGDFQIALVVLHYLLQAGNKLRADKWISEKDLPGGSLFFTAAHALPMDSLIAAFDGRPDLLDGAAQRLGGERTDTAGISYRFQVLPRIPFLLIFWERDEEFAPSCHLLFDETIFAHLRTLDLIWALVNIFVRALLDAAASLSTK
ncbi:MAG: DUF3786 domain-containing protein [Syntrophobacteraceae bacterium]|nr:DUF3786 domain-containing protein [Syntrophobacteraceae bacterium]